MKARPVLMHGRSVRNLLAGRKTQTRRIVNRMNRIGRLWSFMESATRGYDFDMRCRQRSLWHSLTEREVLKRCPYGQPGDLLYVREAWAPYGMEAEPLESRPIFYRADDDTREGWATPEDLRWRPSIHMPRWASRITLRLTDVRVERVQAIKVEDCIREGVEPSSLHGYLGSGFKPAFADLWNDTNGADAWERNDWVWVLTFEVIHANVDEVLADAA